MGSGGSSIADFKASVPILKQELEKIGRDPRAFPDLGNGYLWQWTSGPPWLAPNSIAGSTEVYHNPAGTDASGIHGTPEQVAERLEGTGRVRSQSLVAQSRSRACGANSAPWRNSLASNQDNAGVDFEDHSEQRVFATVPELRG